MMMTGKELNALATLLKLAQEERAALHQDLLDIGAARNAAERSLAQLVSMVEETGARRRRILAMLATYDDAEMATHENLSAAVERARRFEAAMEQAGAKRAAFDFGTSAAGNAGFQRSMG